MKKIRFLGFSTASQVAISVAQNGAAASTSTGAEGWGVGSGGEGGGGNGQRTGTVTINLSRGATQVAPEAVFLTATVAGLGFDGPGTGEVFDPQYHYLDYEWDWGAGAPMFTAPQNLDQRSSRYQYGQKVARVLTSGGTHTVTLRVTNMVTGDWQETTLDITTANPEVHFSEAQTFVVAADGDFTGAPAHGLLHRYTTVQAAVSAASNFAAETRILLKRGTEYTGDIIPGGNLHNLYLGTWGSGAKPVIRSDVAGGKVRILRIADGFGFPASTGFSFTVTGVELRGEVDPVSGSPGAHWGMDWATPGNQVVCLHDTVISKCDVGINASNNPSARFAMSDSVIEDWWGCGFLGSFGGVNAFMGCRMTANPVAPVFIPGLNGGWGVRINKADYCYVSQSDIFVRQGWSASGNPATGHTATQPALRLASDMARGSFAHVDRCSIEGLVTIFSSNVTTKPGTLQNIVITSNRMTAVHDKSAMIVSNSSGLTIYNNIFIAPASREAHENYSIYKLYDGALEMFSSAGQGPHEIENQAGPIRIFGNTFVSQTEESSLKVWGHDVQSRLFTDVQEADNLVYAPHEVTGPQITHGAVDISPAGFEARYVGFFDHDTPLIPKTVTPQRMIEITGASGSFIEGETLTQGGATATLWVVQDTGGGNLRLWTSEETGGFFGQGTVTGQTSGATANAAAGSIYGGPVIVARPVPGSPALDSGTGLTGLIPLRDFYGNTRPMPHDKGAVEAF